MPQYIKTTQISQPLSRTGEQLGALLKSQTGLILLSCLIITGAFSWMSGNRKKGKIATSYWGGGKEKTAAQKKAKKQMQKTTRNNVALYVGTPQEMHSKLQSEWYKQGLIKNTSRQGLMAGSTLYETMATRRKVLSPDIWYGIENMSPFFFCFFPCDVVGRVCLLGFLDIVRRQGLHRLGSVINMLIAPRFL